MLVTQPPTEIAEGLWMLGTGEYPIYLFHARGEAALRSQEDFRLLVRVGQLGGQ